jgi:thiol-disulfide isomerase/thioredoxin
MDDRAGVSLMTADPIEVGARAPAVPGVAFGGGPVALFFYKVTCPTCQLAAPTMEAFERAYPGRVIGIGQDPQDVLEAFAEHHGMGIGSQEDRPPYDVSNAYGIVSVPTLVLVGEDGIVRDTVGAWHREGFNRVSAGIAEALAVEPVVISDTSDGLPEWKPG